MLGRIVLSELFQTTAPPVALWAALESAPRWPQVLDDLLEARIEPDGVLRAGATMHSVARPGTQAVDMTYHVIEADRPRRLVIETGGGALHFRTRTEYVIEADGGGSRLTLTSRIEPVLWLHKLTTELARRRYTERLAGNLKARMQRLLVLAERIAAERSA